MENLKFNPEAELDLRRKVIEYIEQEGINDVVFTTPGKKDRPQKSREELERIFAPYAEIFLEEYAVDSEEDEELKYEESFTESVGLYIAVPDYLQRTHNGFYEFIQTNFPEIKSPHLFKSVEN